MTITVANITFDCVDALAVARFWSAALDQPIDADASTGFASIGLTDFRPGSPAWLFATVPESKSAKNRVHVDLTTTDRAAEAARLVGLGATAADDHDEWGHRWTVLHDPEGNEFCVAETAPSASIPAGG